MSPQLFKSDTLFTHPNLWLSKMKLTSYAMLGSSTPLCTLHGSPTPSSLTDFHDINHACPKDNFPTPFIDQIIDDCVSHEEPSFMDGFFGYNQFQIHLADQYKTSFTTLWGTFSYRFMHFGLKNTGAMLQRAMTYVFHDLAYIILAYLDDLTTRSKQ
jgi:hypothetical protein